MADGSGTIGGAPGPARGTPGRRAGSFTFEQAEDEAPPARDWKKIVLVLGLGALSWVATYVGMLELIEANIGNLPLTHKVIIAGSVAMLMVMIIWLLDQLFSPIAPLTKLVYAIGYVFLTVISVGFGFGFYWKVLESRGEGTRVAETAVGQVQAPLQTATARLETLQRTLDQLKTTSQQKAEIERTQGTSCPNSRPGDGPRRKLRDDDAARFEFASDFVKNRIGGVKGDIAGLEADLVRITKGDDGIVDKSGTRNEFMRTLNRKLDTTVTGFNAFRGDAQLKQIRTELADRAERTQFPDSAGKTFACPDPGLQTMLRSVVASIDALPQLERSKIATVEGSDATIEAFRRLTATLFGVLAFKLPPSAEELRALQQRAVQSAEAGGSGASRATPSEQAGLSKRDYVPLSIAIFVDLCLLLVAMGRPMNASRLGGLMPKMREAERGPVYQILSRFTDIHRDAETREKFELFRHVVFDFNGDYYVAVPLDAPYRVDPKTGRQYSSDNARELQLDAHMLSNLFASFEKERIFSRVYNPMLSTRMIQRKLWRQGSKFAGSQAFRVYRFKDGAWSDIILGAVMGAARRVDAEKRRREFERDLFGTQEPRAERAAPAAGAAEALLVAAGQASPARPQDEKFGPYAVHAAAEMRPPASAAAHKPLRFPYRAAPPPLPEAEVAISPPANGNTAPAADRPQQDARAAPADEAAQSTAVAANVIAMPSPRPVPAAVTPPSPTVTPPADTVPAHAEPREPHPTFDVQVVERTMTVSMPTTEALPSSDLFKAVAGRMASRAVAVEAPAALQVEAIDSAEAGAAPVKRLTAN
jgi:hypothetical protein